VQKKSTLANRGKFKKSQSAGGQKAESVQPMWGKGSIRERRYKAEKDMPKISKG